MSDSRSILSCVVLSLWVSAAMAQDLGVPPGPGWKLGDVNGHVGWVPPDQPGGSLVPIQPLSFPSKEAGCVRGPSKYVIEFDPKSAPVGDVIVAGNDAWWWCPLH